MLLQSQAVLYRVRDGKKEFLLIKKPDLKDVDELVWRLVKGGANEGESLEDCMKREIREEVGLEKVRIGKVLSEYEYEFNNALRKVTVFEVEALNGELIMLSEEEHIKDFKWASEEEALSLLKWDREKSALKKAAEE